MKINAVEIIYNKNIKDSITYQSLKNISRDISNINVLLIDNSTRKFGNSKVKVPSNMEYISMNGNKGLSYAYNFAIRKIKEKADVSNDDIVVLLDDDTQLSLEYFEELKKEAIKNKKIDIFVPIIKGQDNIIYSPNSANFFKNKLIPSITKVNSIKKFNAISSCMGIRLDVFNDYKFDERLFLDEIDQKFCEDQRKRNRSFKAIPIIIFQNFHQREKNLNSLNLWPRFKLRIRDIMIYGSLKRGLYPVVALIKVNLLGIQFGIKTQSLSFIGRTFKESIKTLKNGI